MLARYALSRDAVVAAAAGPEVFAALADLRALTRHHLARFEALRLSLNRTVVPAFLPITLVPLYLNIMERRAYDPYKTVVALPQWRLQWALWRAARRWS